MTAHPADAPAEENKKRREERLASFYRSPPGGGAAAAGGPAAKGPSPQSLPEVDSVFRSEFNTVGYLAIGFSLIALLLIGIIFFRPPKPEAELQALADAQARNRETLEQVASQIAALNQRAERAEQGALARSLKLALVTLGELKERGSPAVRAEAEALQSQIEALLKEVQGATGAGRPP